MTTKKLVNINITKEAYKILHEWIGGDQTLSEAIISADKRLKRFRSLP